MLSCLDQGVPFDKEAFDKECWDMEQLIVSSAPQVSSPRLTLMTYNTGAFSKDKDSLQDVAVIYDDTADLSDHYPVVVTVR
jgi:hypothetical protein